MHAKVFLLGGVLATTIVVVADEGAPLVSAASSNDVVFNEIMYHPEDDHPDGEYLELYNRTGSAINLSGWCIDGVKYCFGSGAVVAAGGYLVTSSADWGGGLKNGGEDIALLDQAGNEIDFVDYDDKGQWPANTDGNGASLQRLDVNSLGDNPGNWVGASPTPGRVNATRSGPLPVWDDVEHTVLPAPGEPIVVTGTVTGAQRADLIYRIGFGPIVGTTVTLVDGRATGQIPGQAAGTLIRYRLRAVAASDTRGTWPRQGDGATWTGTTVATGGSNEVPRFEWFMTDSKYRAAEADLTKSGDDGYPAVFAYNGQIFDNTTVRVKGQSSRYWAKKKWKFVLPDGHELEIDGVIDEAVDEFALHSNWSDKSFLRETLAAEFMERAGLPTSQAFPVALNRNGRFYGLYTYVEQRDGTFRDRNGFDDATVYEVGGNDQFGDMALSHAWLSESQLRRRYDKDTREFEDDGPLRDLIVGLNGSPASRRAYVDQHVDKASVINTIAAAAVIQHYDFGLKNYDLVLNEQGLWEIYPTDFDMTLGHRGNLQCGSLCGTILIGGSFEHPAQPLFAAFWYDPEFIGLIRQRIRTLVEEELTPSLFRSRIDELRGQVGALADQDRSIWRTYGTQQSPADAAEDIMSRYIVPQHNRLLGPFVRSGRVAATSQPAIPSVSILDVQYDTVGDRPPHVILRNNSQRVVDLSGFEIRELDFVVRGGTMLAPGQTAVAVHDDLGRLGGLFSGRVFAGQFGEDIHEFGDGFQLRNREGAIVASWTLVPPRQVTEISGSANTSAFVSIVAAQTRGYGYLQVLDCAAEPGSTSNVTHDRNGQVRAGAGVVRFDADGKLCVYNAAAGHVIVDVQGYFADAAIDDVDDQRLLDTRETGGLVPAGSMTPISGRANSSAMISLAGVRSAGRHFLQVLPCDAQPGEYSNLNFDAANQNRTGLAVVRFDDAGQTCVFNGLATHLVVDLQAYLDESAIDDVDDVRLLDTRLTRKAAAGSQTVITGRPGTSAFVSIVAVATEGRGYVQVLPCGAAPGGSSNVNSDGPRQNVSNVAVVEFDADGRACLFTQLSAHLVVDLQGYLEPGAFDDIDDVRLVDTRSD